MAKIYKTKGFKKRADDMGITDNDLCAMLNESNKVGMVGKDVWKYRVPLPGVGKRGGARTILATAHGKDKFLIYCYPKSSVSATQKEIGKDAKKSLETVAKKLLGFTPTEIATAVKQNELTEVICNGQI